MLSITRSMKAALDISDYRRGRQEAFNKEHHITPTSTMRSVEDELRLEVNTRSEKLGKIPKGEKKAIIKELKLRMLEAAKALEFEEAARLRDEIARINKQG